MAFYGADVQQLKKLSQSLSAGAAQLSGKARELDSLIGQSQSSWQGQDAKHFAAEWQGRLRPLIVNASQDLEEAARKALQNADEQSSASTDGVSGSTSTGIGIQTAGARGTDPAGPARPTPEEILEQYRARTRSSTTNPGPRRDEQFAASDDAPVFADHALPCLCLHPGRVLNWRKRHARRKRHAGQPRPGSSR